MCTARGTAGQGRVGAMSEGGMRVRWVVAGWDSGHDDGCPLTAGVDGVRCGCCVVGSATGWCDMPMRARKACCVPGCGQLADDGQYCAGHRRASSDGDTRGSAAQRGYGHRWRKLRQMVLSAHPLCADPFGEHARDGVVVVATDVHHVDAVRDGNAVLTTMDRLMTLCHSCHSRVTAGARDE